MAYVAIAGAPRKEWGKAAFKVEPEHYKREAEEGRPFFDILAEEDPSTPDHIEHIYRRKLAEWRVDEAGQPNRAKAVWGWCAKAATLDRHLCDYAAGLNEKGGIHRAKVKDFLGAVDSAALFPAYVQSQIQAGQIQVGYVDDLVFATEEVTSMEVIGLYFNDSAAERSLALVGEGAELPKVTVTRGDATIRLRKYGRALEASYEVLANQTVDAMGAYLQRVGQQLSRDEMDHLMHISIAGDGTTLGAAETNANDTDVAAAGTIAWSDVLTWYLAVDEPYQIDVAVLGDTDLALLLNLAEFKDPDVANAYRARRVPSPLQVRLIRWEGGVTGSSYVNRLVVGFDTRYAIKKLRYGALLEESQNVITRQVKAYTISYWVGWQKWDANACQVLDTNAAL